MSRCRLDTRAKVIYDAGMMFPARLPLSSLCSLEMGLDRPGCSASRWVNALRVAVICGLSGCAFISDAALEERLDRDGDGVPRPTDCDDTDPAIQTYIFYADADGDGFGGSVELQGCSAPEGYSERGGDCSDERAEAHPGAVERCNRLDDDCDGEADEDVEIPIWYYDRDGDGYGDLTESVAGCESPSDEFVDNGADCDDGDPAISPDGSERCDGDDNDCDGAIDDDDPDAPLEAWYRDADSDGFGDAAIPQYACAPPSGYVADRTDCDDTDQHTFPEAPELCDDIDNDCDSATGEVGVVTLDRSQNHGSIQDAVIAAVDGSTVRVCDGTYTENISVFSDLTLESAGGPAVTTIDGGGADLATIAVYSPVSVTISGFTITGGSGVEYGGDRWGGGVAGAVANELMLYDNIIEGNQADLGGGVFGSALTVTEIMGCTIRDNEAASSGGGILILYGWAVIEDSDITGNSASVGGGLNAFSAGINPLTAEVGVTLEGTQVTGNQADYGGGLALNSSSAILDSSSEVSFNTASVSGGGVYADDGAALMVSNSIISENDAQYGGGAYISDASIALDSSSELSSNTASSYGGGVYLGGGSLSGGTVQANSAEYGGGVYIPVGSTISSVAIDSNTASVSGGGMYADDGAVLDLSSVVISWNAARYGGGAYIDDASIALDSSSELSSNTASSYGGGVYQDGGSLSGGTVQANSAEFGGGLLVSGESVLSSVVIDGNTASVSGGGVYADDGAALTVSGSIISANTAQYGGGAYIEEASIALDSSGEVSSNTASTYGGGVRLNGGSLSGGTVQANSAEYGGGVYVRDDATIVAVTIDSNTATHGGGVRSYDSALDLTTSILSGNTAVEGGGLALAGGSVALAECSVTGNLASSLGGGAYIESGELFSDLVDWGSGSDDNDPDDVYVLDELGRGSAFGDFAESASFTCSSETGDCQ